MYILLLYISTVATLLVFPHNAFFFFFFLQRTAMLPDGNIYKGTEQSQ